MARLTALLARIVVSVNCGSGDWAVGLSGVEVLDINEN